MIEQAGAAALEVNWYQVNTSAGASSLAVEDELVDMVRDTKRMLKIPAGREALAVLHGVRQRRPRS